jgi:hypothetical protein
LYLTGSFGLILVNTCSRDRLKLSTRCSLETDMDFLYVGLIVALIAVSIALVRGFDKLKGRP